MKLLPQLLVKGDKERQRKYYCILISVILILLLFLKHDGMGNDTPNYRNFYNIVQNVKLIYIFKSLNTEIGFSFFFYICGKLGMSFRIVLLLCAVFYVGIVSRLIYKYSKLPWLSYILFLLMGYFMFFTTMRQMLALTITISSFLLWQEGKYKRALLLAILAVSFHTSALVYPVYLIVSKMNWTKLKFACASLTYIIVFLYRNAIVRFMLDRMGENYKADETGGWILIFEFLLLVVVGGIYYKKIARSGTIMSTMYTMMVITFFVLPLGKFNPFFFRLRHYFAIYAIVFIPNLLQIVKDKVMMLLIISFILMYGGYTFYSTSSTRTIPYVFYWQEYPADKLPSNQFRKGW